MASDSEARIVGQDTLEPFGRLRRTVGHDHLAGVQRVADAHATAVVEAHPRRSARHIQHGIQDGPIGDSVTAVLHALGLAVRAGDRAGVEMVPADHDRRFYHTPPHEVVDRHAKFRPLSLP